MKDSEMEDVVNLTEEERDDIIVSFPILPTPLKTTETSQTQAMFDTDASFVLDAAAFTRLLSEPMSDVNGSIAQHLHHDKCSSTPSLQVAGSCLEAPNALNIPDNTLISRPALLQHRLRMGAHRSTLVALQAQEDCIQDIEQRCRECSTASLVAQRFSDMTIAHGSTPSSLAQSSCSVNTQNLPKLTLTTVSSLSPSVYFPPSASALHQKRRKAKRHEIRAPRPKNCFMLYRSKVLPMIMVELGSINNKVISKIAAERWRAETEPIKTWYRQMAKQGKEEHARNHPGYKYAPNKKLLTMATATVSAPSRADRDYRGEVRDEDDEDEDMDEEDEMDAMDRSHGTRDLPDARRRSPRHDGTLGQSVSYVEFRGSNKRAKTGANVISRHRKPRDSNARALSRTEGDSSGAQEYAMDPSSCLCVSDFYAAFPLSTLEYNSSASSFPLLGSSLIDQQLYLQVQQPKIQQSHTPLLQDQNQLQASTLYTGVPGVSSFYDLTADMNSSSSTLVDPVNNWMTHRYQDPGTLYEHLHFADAHKVAGSSNTRDALQKSLDLQAGMKGPMEMTHLLLDKDLPPLPFEISVQDSAFESSSFDDPQMILSHLYAEYNNPGDQQEFPLQLLAAKECEPQMFSMQDNDFGFDDRLLRPPALDELQGHQHQQQLQQQQHQQQYLIKPAYPTGFMSFTDIGEGAFSSMDMFTWPSQH
ncbi:hypothetical protein KVV02_002984 [Mortierella alpina]|uniref:HMG box domain-containing protein n=1 Tax=Mortierella alpina TaxID=64518 RepID=A0A9P8A4G1_MORAP|nr:hypothetical protein KVV02_002984 [Mortierella alpina]